MATNNITIKFADNLYNKIKEEQKGASLSYTVTNLLDNYLTARVVSLAELKGVFTPEEWMFFAESLNGSLAEGMFRFSKSAFIAHCEDSLLYQGSQFNISLEDIKEKVSHLSASNIDALYNRVEQYWKYCDTLNLKEWAKW